jgi:hypothetical protein
LVRLGRENRVGLCSRSGAESAAEFDVTSAAETAADFGLVGDAKKNGGFRRSFLVGEQSEESSSCSAPGVA